MFQSTMLSDVWSTVHGFTQLFCWAEHSTIKYFNPNFTATGQILVIYECRTKPPGQKPQTKNPPTFQVGQKNQTKTPFTKSL